MSAIFILIGFSLILALGFLAAFLWAVNSEQYEDAYTPSVRILLDDSNLKHYDSQPDTSAHHDGAERSA